MRCFAILLVAAAALCSLDALAVVKPRGSNPRLGNSQLREGGSDVERELQLFKKRNRLLEEALKTLRSQAAPSTADADLRARAEEAESLVAELQAQVSNELKRTERMRISWQGELVKLSERAGLVEDDARRWKALAESAAQDADKFKARVKALETALQESEQQLKLLEQEVDSSSVKPERALKEAQQRFDAMESKSLAEIKALQAEVDSLSAQVESLQQSLSDAKTQESETREIVRQSVAAAVAASAAASASARGADDSGGASNTEALGTVDDELGQQRKILQRQSALLEALFVELAVQGNGNSSGNRGASSRPQLPASGDTLQAFSVRGTTEAGQKRSASTIATPSVVAAPGPAASGPGGEEKMVKTQEIIVDGDPFLIDEDNNLYSVNDHAFVRKLASSTKLKSSSSISTEGKGGRGAGNGTGVVGDDDDDIHEPRVRRRRRAERLTRIGDKIGQGVEKIVGGAKFRLAAVSRGLFNLLVGDRDDDGDDDEVREGGEGGNGGARPGNQPGQVVDVGYAVEMEGNRAWDGSKMRPPYLDEQKQTFSR